MDKNETGTIQSVILYTLTYPKSTKIHLGEKALWKFLLTPLCSNFSLKLMKNWGVCFQIWQFHNTLKIFIQNFWFTGKLDTLRKWGQKCGHTNTHIYIYIYIYIYIMTILAIFTWWRQRCCWNRHSIYVNISEIHQNPSLAKKLTWNFCKNFSQKSTKRLPKNFFHNLLKKTQSLWNFPKT